MTDKVARCDRGW